MFMFRTYNYNYICYIIHRYTDCFVHASEYKGCLPRPSQLACMSCCKAPGS